jgi:hypothetical protein
MLIGWIRAYETRRDTFSLGAHRTLFDGFAGEKIEPTKREPIAAIGGMILDVVAMEFDLSVE